MRKGKKKTEPVDLGRVRTYPLGRRRNLVDRRDFASLVPPSPGIERFLASFPNILAGRDMRSVAREISKAHQSGRHVVAAMGAHVIKCGLSPILIDLMERGIITAVAMNGAGAIHDSEVAMIGATSEDVAGSLEDGSFGMARETAEAYAEACRAACRSGAGLGAAMGRVIVDRKMKFRKLSILAAAHTLDMPATVHVAVGTDIVHMHPCVSAGQLGEASMTDFKIICSVVSDLQDGVWLNIGSAVILPEVFLKALNVARNLGRRVNRFTTANLDMTQHYRPTVNVLSRPGGKAYGITGRHELVLPLLRMMVLCEIRKRRAKR